MIVVSFLAMREQKWPGVDERCYEAMLDMLDASCRKLHLRHVCISDKPRRVETFQCPLPSNLMQAILAGQLQWLKQAKGPTLFTGADCLITRDPTDACKGYDLCITNRHPGDINTGFVWADSPKLIPVWQAALDSKPQAWGQDQTALLTAIRAHQAGLRIRELPMEDYNRKPRPEWDSTGRLPVVLHCKGFDAKAQMAPWFRRYIERKPIARAA